MVTSPSPDVGQGEGDFLLTFLDIYNVFGVVPAFVGLLSAGFGLGLSFGIGPD
jgi:hypothetical protein